MRAMKKTLLFFSFFIVLGINLYLITTSYLRTSAAQQQQKILTEIEGLNLASQSKVLGVMSGEMVLGDSRADNLRNFFRKYRSPLYDWADAVVSISDTYQFDYRLLPAIAMQESGLCKFAPDGSHNCWGYGIYGGKRISFNSYQEAIETVAKGLKKNYLDKGYTTPELIMSKYTPRSPGSWARSINLFITSLE